jgi:hypothetical protein
MTHIVEGQWEEFLTMVYPQGAPEGQTRGLRAAFYAGSLTTLFLQSKGHDKFELGFMIMEELDKIQNDKKNFNSGEESSDEISH